MLVSSRRRLVRALLISIAALAVAPASALALTGDVSVKSGLVFAGGDHVVVDTTSLPGETTTVTVYAPAANEWWIDFSPSSSRPAPGTDCVVESVSTIKCINLDPADFARGVEINTGSGNETIRMSTGPGSAEGLAPLYMSPGAGTNTLRGGAGNDFFNLGSAGMDTTVINTVQGNDGTDEWTLSQGYDVLDYSLSSQPVKVSMDCVANDGATGENENAGCHTSSAFNAVKGSYYNDTFTGDDGSNTFYGMNGNDNIQGFGGADDLRGNGDSDYIVGGAGADTMYGDSTGDTELQPGSDTIDARDGAADTLIDCGQNEDKVLSDGKKSAPGDTFSRCENQEFAVAETQTPPPAVDPRPKATVNGAVVPLNDTTRTIKMDNLVGYDLAELGLAFAFTGVNADMSKNTVKFMTANKLPKHPRGQKWRQGDVIAQSPAVGANITFSAGKPVKLALTVWGGPKKDDCVKEAQAFEGLNIDVFRQTMLDFGCKIDDVEPTFVSKVKGDDRCEVGQAYHLEKKGAFDVIVNIPRDSAKHDLRLVIGTRGRKSTVSTAARTNTLPLLAPGWNLSAQAQGVLTGWVMSRSGNYVNNVSVWVDYQVGPKSPETQRLVSGSNGTPGEFNTGSVMLPSSGVVEILALGFDKNGKAVCGAAKVNVLKYKRTEGSIFTTITGRKYEFQPGAAGGNYLRRKDLEAAAIKGKALAGGTAKTRVTHAFNPVDLLVGWWNSLWGGKPNAPSANLPNADTSGRGLVQIAANAPLNGKAQPALVLAAQPGQLVAAGGLNFTGTSASGGWLIGNDGSTLIGNDGSTLVGNDGASLVAAGGGNLVMATSGSGAGTNLVAAGGLNLVAAGGGNVGGPAVNISTAISRDVQGNRLIGNDGSTLVAAGGLNLVAAGGLNLVAAGGLN